MDGNVIGLNPLQVLDGEFHAMALGEQVRKDVLYALATLYQRVHG